MNFAANDKIVILTFGGEDYIQKLVSTSSPFTMFPGANGCSPTVELWEAAQATSCNVNNDYYIRDQFGNKIPRLVGSRPANIVRR